MFSITLPGKTFLLGEYVVLDGGPGLMLTTPPYFEMHLRDKPQLPSVPNPAFHPQSPAGLWIEKNSDFFKQYHLDFFDPHEGKGGFGASSAQFISVYAALHSIEKTAHGMEKLLADYFSVVKSTEGVLPSGADLVAQVCKDITYWHRAEQQLDQVTWPFQQLSYCLIRTGYKCATHQSLKKLPPDALVEMSDLVKQGYAAFRSADSLALVNAVNEYAAWMKRVNCVVATTEDLLQFFASSRLIEAAKGCGALGADVILVLLATEKLPSFLAWLQERDMIPVNYL